MIDFSDFDLTCTHYDPSSNPRDLTRIRVGAMPADVLLSLPGRCGEHEIFSDSPTGRYSPEEWAALVADIKEHGIRDRILICVEDTGEAAVWEGNHRIRVAAELGIPVPVEVRHFGTEGGRDFHLFPRSSAEVSETKAVVGANQTPRVHALLYRVAECVTDGAAAFVWRDFPNGGGHLRADNRVIVQGPASDFEWWKLAIEARGCTLTRLPTLKVRMADSTDWAILDGRRAIGLVAASGRELNRWAAADVNRNPEGHPCGWFTKRGAYRNPADESNVMKRWRVAHPDTAKRYS